MRGNNSAGFMFLPFLFGGLLGAGIALLLAPESGRKTRRRIRNLAEEVREKAEDCVEQVKSTATTALEKGKDLF